MLCGGKKCVDVANGGVVVSLLVLDESKLCCCWRDMSLSCLASDFVS